MVEDVVTKEKLYTKEGELVIPLDEVRTYDKYCNIFTSGGYTSGYIIQSGKVAYIKQLLVTELSGHPGRVWLTDERGSGEGGWITPQINITENTTMSWDPNFACGPIQSGIRIYNEELWGRATLVVQIDPQVIE